MTHLTLQLRKNIVLFLAKKHIPKVSRPRSRIMPFIKPWATRNMSYFIVNFRKSVLVVIGRYLLSPCYFISTSNFHLSIVVGIFRNWGSNGALLELKV